MGLAVSSMQTLFSNWRKTMLVSRLPLGSSQKLPFSDSLIFSLHSLSCQNYKWEEFFVFDFPAESRILKQDLVTPLPDVSANQSRYVSLKLSEQSLRLLVLFAFGSPCPFPISLA